MVPVNVVVVVVVFTLNRSFYPRTSSAVRPVSVLIILVDTNSVVTDSETEKKTNAKDSR